MPKSVTFADALLVDEDVLGLDVAVDDAALVGGAERARDLDRVGDRLGDRQPAVAADAVLERLALDVLEDDVRASRRSSSPASMTPTMCGWLSWATARASRRKRSSWSESEAISRCISLIATWRSSTVSKAR